MPPTPTFPVNPHRQDYDDSNSQQNSEPSNARQSTPQRRLGGSDRDQYNRLHPSNFFAALSSLAENDRITGLFMMACALAGLILANLPETGPGLNALAAWIPMDLPGGLNLSLKDWIQDGLLTIFFLTMGLDLRQEAATGTLRDHRQVLLPMLAALGGVAVPILIYCLLNLGSPAGLHGWAVPTATDVAFSLAALQLLLPQAGPALQAFLMTLAIFDDLIGVLLIALGYSSAVQPGWLLVCLVGLVAWALLIRAASHSAWLWRPLVPLCLLGALAGGLLAWYSLFKAGIHPVLAGVAMGLLTPVARSDDTGIKEASADTAPNRPGTTEHRPTDTEPSGTSQANTEPAEFGPTGIGPSRNPTLSPAERLDLPDPFERPGSLAPLRFLLVVNLLESAGTRTADRPGLSGRHARTGLGQAPGNPEHAGPGRSSGSAATCRLQDREFDWALPALRDRLHHVFPDRQPGFRRISTLGVSPAWRAGRVGPVRAHRDRRHCP